MWSRSNSAAATLVRASRRRAPLSLLEPSILFSRFKTSLASNVRVELPPAPVGTYTKIVCTMGPSTTDDDGNKVSDLLQLGMHVARLNFSHSTNYDYVKTCFDLVRKAPGRHGTTLQAGSSREQFASPLPANTRAVLVDTKGPEIRTGPLRGNVAAIMIATDQVVHLTTESVVDDTDDDVLRLQVDYASIAKTLKVDSMVLLDDGLIALQVTEIIPNGVNCVALNGGEIKARKGVNLPNCELDLPALTDKDKADLEWAVQMGADFVAASFIRTADNVRAVIAFLDRCVADLSTQSMPSQQPRPLRPLVISKIESKEGVDNFDAILRESDGIMVARGDLGVEIPYSKVFAAQKRMVKACNQAGKPVIVATQMLDSMMRNPRPTRAEVTDVGTAVLDGADAVMLSGETAAGKYPIDAVKAMASVVWEADQIVNSTASAPLWNQALHDSLPPMEQELDAVAAAACQAARDMHAKMIILITMTGRVARAVARHRPTVPVLAFCTDAQVARRLQLHRAVTPIVLQTKLDPGDANTKMGHLRAEAVRVAKVLGYGRAGDRVIMVDRAVGKPHDMHEYSHNLKVATLREV